MNVIQINSCFLSLNDFDMGFLCLVKQDHGIKALREKNGDLTRCRIFFSSVLSSVFELLTWAGSISRCIASALFYIKSLLLFSKTKAKQVVVSESNLKVEERACSLFTTCFDFKEFFEGDSIFCKKLG